MTFEYLRQPNFRDPSKPWISRPLIPVRLFHGDQEVVLLGLLDSGADVSLFDASVASTLGMDAQGGGRRRFRGIAGDEVEGYVHRLRIQVRGDRAAIELEAAFVESLPTAGIIGQEGFFDHYRITFDRAKERIEITRRPRSPRPR